MPLAVLCCLRLPCSRPQSEHKAIVSDSCVSINDAIGPAHLAGQDAAADGHVAGEGALVVNVVACGQGNTGQAETRLDNESN